MRIAITGASGFIGRRLVQQLSGHSLIVFSRAATLKLPPGAAVSVWDPMSGPPRAEALQGADAVIHLAGEPVAQRWTAAAKQRIHDSRVTGTRHLVQALARMDNPPAALICASAIGYYGSRGDEVLSEASPPGAGFLPNVCVAWEREADTALPLGMRVAKIRIGIVLDPLGGALASMLPPFRAGVGGPLGPGRQWMSWIHLDDLVRLIIHTVEQPLSGPINAVAPGPVRNSEFTRALGRALHRPAFLPLPGFALKVLFGEMAEVLLGSQRVIPFAAEASGFRFAYPQLDAALRDLLLR